MARILKITAAATSKGFAAREETFDGRPHLVVPVVALVEGVLHAMNSATPEMVFAEEFTRPAVVGGFNGRPLYHGHPLVNGEPVSGNDPLILDELCIGRVFHSATKNNKLTMEAWIDIERCENIAPNLLARVKDAKDIEISVGVFCESDEAEAGEYGGKKYTGSWRDIVPDHLALLLDGDRGACSREMGCGVRAARDISQDERDKMPENDFAGPNRSFPIAEPVDVHNAAQSLGRAKGDRDAIKAKIIAIAHRKGAAFVAQLPEAWDMKSAIGNGNNQYKHDNATKDPHERAKAKARNELHDKVKQLRSQGRHMEAEAIEKANKMGRYATEGVKKMSKTASALTKFLSLFRTTQAPEEMSDNDVRRNLLDALREDDKTVNYVEAFYPNAAPATVVYSCYYPSSSCGPEMGMGYQSCMYQRSYSVGDNGVVVLGEDIMEVEPVLTYQPVPAEGEEAPTAAQGAPCKCHDHKDTRSEIDMNKEQIAKFLETATDEQIKALSAVVETPATAATEEVKTPAAAVVETPKVETPAVASAAKTPTFEEMLATAEPSVRDAIAEGQRVGVEKRNVTIKALKDTGRCDMSDKELAALSQAQLDQLVKLAGAPKTDFSVAGGSRAAVEANAIPAAPDLTAAIKAAREVKK